MISELKDEKLRLRIVFSNSDNTIQQFKDVLELLQNSLLPTPNEIQRPDTLKFRIDGFTAALVWQNLESSFNSMLPFQLLNGIENTQVISPPDTIFSTTQAELLPDGYIQKCVKLVKNIVATTDPKYVNCCFHEVSRKIYFRHFEFQDRTPVSPNLEWLQYYGPEEYEKQGGEAILSNPHIQAEQLGEGLLIQVGAGPEDALTDDGEDLLVKATKTMPPVNS